METLVFEPNVDGAGFWRVGDERCTVVEIDTTVGALRRIAQDKTLPEGVQIRSFEGWDMEYYWREFCRDAEWNLSRVIGVPEPHERAVDWETWPVRLVLGVTPRADFGVPTFRIKKVQNFELDTNRFPRSTTVADHEPVEIPGVHNYYGGLSVKREGGIAFWSVENYDGHYFEVIPDYLYDALMRFRAEI
jgi:hypothetical protein